MAKATVVIPNYNGMKYLPQCIEALRKQTVSCFDILVVENGSSDGSAEWLEASQVPMLKEFWWWRTDPPTEAPSGWRPVRCRC